MKQYKNSYELFSEVTANRGISAYRVAMETKIPQSAFSLWKLYNVCPKYERMKRIAEYLSTPERPLNAVDFLDLDIKDQEGR